MTANETLQEEAVLAAVALALALRKFKRAVRASERPHDREIVDIVRRFTDRPVTTVRIERLLGRINVRVDRQHDELRAASEVAITEQIKTSRDGELAALAAALILPSAFGMSAPLVGQVRRSLVEQVVAGRTSEQWWRKIRADKKSAIEATVRSEAEAPSLVPSVRETTQRLSNSAVAVAGTLVGVAGDVAREEVWRSNDSVFADKMWLSVMDGRTTRQFCVPRNGKRYTVLESKPIGHKFPWLEGPGRIHIGCRSSSHVRVPGFSTLATILSGGIGSFRRRLRRRGMSETQIEQARGSLRGDIPAEFDFRVWLPNQSAARQDAVLGRRRGLLLRRGGVDPGAFYDRNGRLRSLANLYISHPDAFQAVGLIRPQRA